MFGTLYYGKNDLAGAILEAVVATPDMDQEALDQKLYEISAENFGRRVEAFYQDLIDNHDLHHAGDQEETAIKRLSNTIVYLPKKIAYLPVTGSKHILKISSKQLKRLRPGKNEEEQ